MDKVSAIDLTGAAPIPATFFSVPRQYEPYLDAILISHGLILDRCVIFSAILLY